MTRQEFVPIIAYLSAAVNKPLEREQAEVYFDALQDLPAQLVLFAAKRAVLENEYPTIPPVGTLRRLALEASAPASLAWVEAWGLVCGAVNRFGLSRQQQGLDSLPSAARGATEAIGWRALCNMRDGECDTLRAQFRDAYGTLRAREDRVGLLPPRLREQLPCLVGRFGALPAPRDAEEGGRQ